MTKLVKITASLLICLKTKIKLKSLDVLESKGFTICRVCVWGEKREGGREGGREETML